MSSKAAPRRRRGASGGVDRLASWLLPAAAVASLLLAWALTYRSTSFLPAPSAVLAAAPEFLSDGETWANIGISVRRLMLGLVAGTVLAVVVVVVMNASRALQHVLSVYVGISLRVPSAIAAIMALVAFRRSEFGYPAVIAFIAFPFVVVGLADGVASADRRLQEMARLYHFGAVQSLRHVLAPAMAPYLFGALRNAHALAWKVIVVAEIFGAAERGFGASFNFTFRNFQLTELMLWLLIFMAVLLVMDYGALRQLERWVGRWRG